MRQKKHLTMGEIIHTFEALAKIPPKKNKYDLEVEIGGMMFKVDIENLERLMITMLDISKSIEEAAKQ